MLQIQMSSRTSIGASHRRVFTLTFAGAFQVTRFLSVNFVKKSFGVSTNSNRSIHLWGRYCLEEGLLRIKASFLGTWISKNVESRPRQTSETVSSFWGALLCGAAMTSISASRLTAYSVQVTLPLLKSSRPYTVSPGLTAVRLSMSFAISPFESLIRVDNDELLC